MLNQASEIIPIGWETSPEAPWGIVGGTDSMRKIFDVIPRVAQAEATVMITGESGTGKELVARAIHESSARGQAGFVALNCGVLSTHLVESELFGHEKGAFTGAMSRKVGRFEAANGGTFLLDEVTEMSLDMQGKFLRVIQEGEFERVGSSVATPVDVRLIATTNRNLSQQVRDGKFREDLFFRLNVIPIRMPPLKDRVADIPGLVHHFIEKHNKKNHRAITGIIGGAMGMLMGYSWPGNIRELENIVERAVVLAKGHDLILGDFPLDVLLGHGPVDDVRFPIPMTIEAMKDHMITRTLDHFGGNKTRAAEALGIETRTIRNRLYGRNPKPKREN